MRRQKLCLHNRARKEKIPLYVGKTQTMAWQRAGLGNKGRMALSTLHTCASYTLCPQQSVTTWAKLPNYKYWEWTHTYLRSTAQWRVSDIATQHRLVLQFFYYAAHHYSTKQLTNGSSIIILLSLKGNLSSWAAACPTYPTSSKSDSKQLFVTFLQSVPHSWNRDEFMYRS